MNKELLKGLFQEYANLLDREQEYQEYTPQHPENDMEWYRNIPDRPTQADFERIGMLIRQQTIKAEKKYKKDYWDGGFD